MSRIFTRLGFTAVAIIAGAVPAMAQGTQTASLAGQAVDKTGKKLEGVRVVLASPNMQGQRTILTDGEGRFISRLLPPGTYTITLAKEGFESVTLTQRIGLEQTSSPKVTMSPVGNAVVEVIATSAGADKTEFKSAINYTKDSIDSLPVRTSSSLEIAYLSPGVAKSANAAQGEIEIRGSQGSGNLIMVDGQNVMDNLYGGQRIGTIFDAVEETQVLTGAIPAEYGYIEGGVINQITKSGGNSFSGSIRYDLENPQWNAVAPKQSRTNIPNNLTEGRSVTLGGPIFQDKLWFFFGYYDAHPQTAKTFVPTDVYDGADGSSINPAPGFNTNFTELRGDYRREFKLTYSPTPEHTITATFNNSKLGYNRTVGSGEQANLAQFATTGEFWNVSWRGILTSNLTMNARYGEKKQNLGNSSTNPDAYFHDGLIESYTNGANYGSGYWDANDPQKDSRLNKTAAFKASLFWTAMGSHETDMGFDNYTGTIKASGYQSEGRINIPGVGNGLNLWSTVVANYDPITRTFAWDNATALMRVMQYVPDQMTTNLNGLYVNDKWTLNEHFLFNIGLRYDFYDVKSTAIGEVSKNSALSPRLGVKYDIWADSKLVAGFSFSRMSGRPLESTFSAGTYVNNPVYIEYYTGPGAVSTLANNYTAGSTAGWYPISQLQNPGQYFDLTQFGYYANAAVNIQFDKKTKPVQVDEMQLTLTYNYKHQDIGDGFVRLTAVDKKWSNLIDAAVGSNGTVTDTAGHVLDVIKWGNAPDAEKRYKALEFDAQLKKGAWFLTANVSWTDLTGNYVGEGVQSPGSGQFLHNYDNLNGVRQYDWKTYNPTGRLVTIGAQSPLAINAQASHTYENAIGPVTWGFSYQFRSGQHYSDARTFNLYDYYPALGANAGSSQVTATQYLNGQRGGGVFNGFASLDASVQQDYVILKAKGRPVTGFVKASVTNLWNHQQALDWATGYNSTSDPTTPFVRKATYGTQTSSANFAVPRQVFLAAGLKF